ncbi:DNA-binding protein [Mycolicibacterium aromaticivorans JS19b1 = JCM 16368]|uniref:DNA-binding protein n=1 Tax=Mycolicibacterium aromaticivorans JS19b1 = JCM 16368 TaxID=1440774 RepID=A0A064CFH6_9MYCO|nr:helicase-associated domain-containing protein [Mycolicibacterium aromaticivorans]KDE99090.1 DNA-binding protein [Mycolicibacterium aromaticivorans JS19b1 = JCM 16368]
MSAQSGRPAGRSEATREDSPGVPLGAWLADLPDDRLIRLLELRPDLAQPAPGSIAALAARAVARQSVKAATDELDYLRLAVLDALIVLHAETAATPVAKLVALVGERADEKSVMSALDDLRERALVWGDSEVRVSAEAAAALPWYPGQAIGEDSARSGAEISAAINTLDEPQLELLDRLLMGSPVGRTRDAAPGAPADRPVPRLLAAGLLRQLDAETVILPRNVGQVLRGEEPGPASLTPPDPVSGTTTVADVDAAAAGAVLDLIREIELVIESLSAAPVSELRSGGLGVREAKRLSKLTGIDEQRLGLVLEVSSAAGLIASGTPDPEPQDGASPYWTPTVAADRFLETPTAARWHLLASSWLELPSRPGLIGSRGPDGKPYAALSDSLYSTAAPLDRRLLLELLAELPPGSGVDAPHASRALIWRRPRWAARLQPEPVAHLLDEAHAVGLIGRGALSTPARVLLAGSDDAAIDAMGTALPAPIDHFLVQADLTVVVPGPLQRDLADELAAVAAVESAGAAMVYRVSEASIRHALDTGRTAGGLHTFFGRYSKTPVPQGLTYLINDVARRHGQLRVGMASSFLRCEDPTLLAHAVAAPDLEHLEVRLLAPTVAVSQAPIGDVLAALRAAGFAPAAEDSSGAIVDLRQRGARVSTPQHRRPFRALPKPSTDTLASVVAVLRRMDSTTPFANVRLDPAVSMALLQQAAMEQKDVVIGYVDAAGVATQRVVRPLTVSGGQLMAWDPAQGRPREFAVHRVTSVMSADAG